ncbi:MAG: hypothetical protein RR404_01475 [Bacilli bacterium]
MKGFLIGPDNERFEADIVRYFQNVNDKYLIYKKNEKNEKDQNGYILLNAVKVVNDNGIKVGETIVDENEWSLIKNFLNQTVTANKEGKKLSIIDCNPVEINDLKINNQRQFKLKESVADLFGQNKKSFEIIQQMANQRNTVEYPVAPEVTEFVTRKPVTEMPSFNLNTEATINSDTSTYRETATNSETLIQPVVNVTAPNPVGETSLPTFEINSEIISDKTDNFEELYKKEIENNDKLLKEIDELIKDNANLKAVLDKLREIINE